MEREREEERGRTGKLPEKESFGLENDGDFEQALVDPRGGYKGRMAHPPHLLEKKEGEKEGKARRKEWRREEGSMLIFGKYL